MRYSRKALLASMIGGVCAAGLSCSLTVPQSESCEFNEDCRARFGFNSVCSVDTGTCGTVDIPNRCAQTYPSDLFENEDDVDAIVFGALGDQSVATERGRLRAIELAIRLADQQGGLDGRTVGMVFCDTQSDTEFGLYGDGLRSFEASVEAADFLTGTLRLPAVVGPSPSTDAEIAYYAVVRPRDAMMISAAATSSGLTGLDPIPATDQSPGLFWRTAPPDRAVGEAIANNIIDRNVRSVFILGVAGYGQILGNTVQEGLALAPEPIDVDLRVWQLGEDLARGAAIQEALNSPAEEIVFLSSYTQDTVEFVEKYAAAAGTKRVFLSESAANADFLAADAASTFGEIVAPDKLTLPDYNVRIARFSRPDSIPYRNFSQQYEAFFGESPADFSFAAHAFDAGWLLAFGAAWAVQNEGRISGQGIARGLRRMSDKTAGVKFTLEQANWRAAQAQLSAGVNLDVEGASGQLDYDSQTEETTGFVEVLAVVPQADRFVFQAIVGENQ